MSIILINTSTGRLLIPVFTFESHIEQGDPVIFHVDDQHLYEPASNVVVLYFILFSAIFQLDNSRSRYNIIYAILVHAPIILERILADILARFKLICNKHYLQNL